MDENAVEEIRQCRKCCAEKPAREFPRNAGCRGGCRPICRRYVNAQKRAAYVPKPSRLRDPVDADKSKRCSKCLVEKPGDEFSTSKMHRLGLSSRCKQCTRARYRDPSPRGQVGKRPNDPVADFFRQIDKSGGPDACWPWLGARDAAGYGNFSMRKRPRRAHRHSYELAVGPIPEGMFVCHRCDNPPCCNPSHLFLGTPADNSADMTRKGRSLKGERNRRRKLCDTDIPKVRALIAGKRSMLSVAAKFGVSHQTIRRIIRKTSWRHVA